MGYSKNITRREFAPRDLYRAALLDDPLSAWSQMIADFLEMKTASITVFDSNGIAVEIGSTESGLALGREYIKHSQHINPLLSLWQKIPFGTVIRLNDQIIEASARASEFYQKYGAYLDRGKAICMVLGIRGARVLVHASHPLRETAEPAQKLFNLQDDLLLSFEIAGRFTLANNMNSAIIRSLDQKGIGLALLAEDGLLEYANGSMSDILEAGKILRIDHGRVAPGSHVNSNDLSSIVQRARKNGVGGRLRYGETAADRGSIVAYPAPVSFAWEGARDGKVVLIAADSIRAQAQLASNLRNIWSLTQAETRVAEMLMRGKTSRQMADELGVQINSIRAHLKAIYSKTNTHSQVELMKLLQVETGNAH